MDFACGEMSRSWRDDLRPTSRAWDDPVVPARIPRPHVNHRPVLFALLACLCGCAASLPTEAVVGRVIDGDTIELRDGRLVRYIGMDTPEVRRREGDRWVYAPEPFAEAATQANERLVGGKTVRLEYDVQTRDRYGRLLAYVYVGDLMVNAEMLRLGFAQLLTIPPDVKHVARFRALAQEAREAHRGLWRATEGSDPKRKSWRVSRLGSDP